MSLVHMVIDEAAALGHLPAIDDMLATGRGYGLRCHLYFQNAAQLVKCYPDGQHQFVLGTTTNIFMAAHDWVTCEEISKRTGSETVVVGSGGVGDGDSRQSADGAGRDSYGTSRNRNTNWAYTGRPLLRPEQVAALPERVAVVFAPGVGAPLLTWVTRCHEEPPPPTPGERFRASAVQVARPLLAATVAVLAAVGVTVMRTDPPARPASRRPPAAAAKPPVAPPTESPKGATRGP